jgi:hypothetical protein
LSSPIAEKLDLIPQTLGGARRAKMQDATQLLAHSEPLLRRQNHSGVFSAGLDPLGVEAIEI